MQFGKDSGSRLTAGKRVEIALSYIYGVGRSRAAAVLAQTGINPIPGSVI